MLGALLLRSGLHSGIVQSAVCWGAARTVTTSRTFQTLPSFVNAILRTSQLVSPARLGTRLHQSATRWASRSSKTKSKRLSFEVDSNISADVLIYSYSNDRFFRMVSIFGVVQFLFWCNIAYFAYSVPKLVDERGKQPFREGSWWAMVAQLQSKYKNYLAVTCIGLGYLVLFFAIIYPQRSISTLSLLRGGQALRITTYNHMASKKTFEVPIDRTSCMQMRTGPGTTVPIKVKGRWFYFLMEKRGGQFHETELFDFVVGLKRDLKR